MEKHINIILLDKTAEFLELRHNFIVSRVGYYEKPRDHYIERADLNDAVLLLCLGGSGYVEYKDRNYEIHRGDVAFLEPNVPHKYGANDDDRWTVLWIHFNGDGITGMMALFKKFNINNIFHAKNYQSAAEDLNNIILLLSNNYTSMEIHKACSLLQMILLNFVETYSNTSLDDNHYIKEAVQFMKINLYNNMDLKTISQHLGISTFHTIRIFKSSFMATPMQYYNILRINEASRLLLSTDMTIAEISWKFNYSSQYYFSQQFKKKMGVSPIAYKKLMNNKF